MGYRLEDLIDIEQFQGLQDRLNELYSLQTAIIDCDGNILTASGRLDICTEFHRKSRDCESECLRSSLNFPDHLQKNNSTYNYRCPRGLFDNVIPIIISGHHYASFYTGQFFLEAPDLEVFRAQALTYGFSPEAYLDAVKKVPVWPFEQMQNYLRFINSLIELIASSGLKKLQAIEAHKKGEEHEERAGAILNQMSDGFWMIDAQGGRIVDVNHAMCEMLGYSRDELLQLAIADIDIVKPVNIIQERIQKIVRDGSDRFESRFRRKDGSIIDVEISVTYIRSMERLFGFHRDITERKRASEAIQRLNRKLRAISECGQVLVRAEDEKTLLRDICQVICEVAGYRMAWVGYVEPEPANTLRPITWAGEENGYLADLKITWDHSEYGRGAAGTAIRTGEIVHIQDYATDPRMAVWRKNALQHGFLSGIALPLKEENGQVFGTLNIFSGEAYAFSTEEIHLLDELASDLAFGILVLRAHAKRQRAEQALAESEERFRTLIEQSSEGVVLTDEHGRFIEWNRAQAQITGLTSEQVIGQFCWDIQYNLLPKERKQLFTHEKFSQAMRYALTMGDVSLLGISKEFEIETAHGERKYIVQTSFPIKTELGSRIGGIVRDVTEERRMEAELHERARYIETIMENAPIGFAVRSIYDSSFRYISNRFESIYGVPHGTFQSFDIFFKHIIPDVALREQMHANVEGFMTSGNLDQMRLDKFPVKLDSGEIRYVTATNIPIAGQKLIVSTVQDVTENVRAEKALRESEEKFVKSFQDAPVLISITDLATGEIIDVNEEALRVSGFTREEMLGHCSTEIGWTTDEVHARLVQELRMHQRIDGLEVRFCTKDKSIILGLVKGEQISIAGRDCLLTITVDISERKRTEEALLQSQEQLQAVVQSANDAIITIDAYQKIVIWNQAARRIFGYTADEMIGQSILRLLPANTFADEPQAVGLFFLQNVIHNAGGETLETAGVKKGGREFPIEMSFAAWKAQSGPFVTVIVRDISERKQRENELRTIVTLSSALRTAPTRKEMLPVIIRQVISMINYEAVTIEIIDPTSGDIVVEAGYGLWKSLVGTRQPPDAGINAVIARTLQPYSSQDLEMDPVQPYPAWAHVGIRGATGVPLIAHEKLIGFIWGAVTQPIADVDVRLLSAIADIAANAIYRATLHEQTKKDAADLTLAYDTTLEGWAHALELRDQETVGHTRRVTQKTVELARLMGFSGTDLENIRRGALLHDIGKMGIPDSVLLKPGTLNEREWEIMRRHTEYARDMLMQIEYLHPALDIPYCHHEKWDGSGYPRGLKGEDIPLAARIFAVVDVWDALTNDRPYRKAWSTETTLAYLHEHNRRQFDPRVLEFFMKTIAEEASQTDL